MTKTTAALLAAVLLAPSAGAIELSLEENRAERGSVGYVDMQRLFADSPDAARAKESFQELLRQAEERVNGRKAELLKLRQELDETRARRDELARSASAAPPPPQASTATAASAPVAQAAQTQAPPVVGTPPGPQTFPTNPPPPNVAPTSVPTVPTPPVPPAAAQPQPQTPANNPPLPGQGRQFSAALPGMTASETAPTAPPAAPAVASSSAPAVSTAAVAAAASMFPAPPPPSAPAVPAGPTLAQRLLELDARIISLQADIARKEGELTREHDEADRGLLDVESRKTDQVLARLYRAITETARREGVSVVVDKTTILYGHPAVDLTDKVLKHLREAQP